MELFKILGLCLTGAVFAVLLKSNRPETATVLSVAVGIIIMGGIISELLGEIFTFRDLIASAGVKSAYFTVALKALGICLVTGAVSDICQDFGQTAIGNFAVAAGRAAIFTMSVPLLSELLGAAMGFIG